MQLTIKLFLRLGLLFGLGFLSQVTVLADDAAAYRQQAALFRAQAVDLEQREFAITDDVTGQFRGNPAGFQQMKANMLQQAKNLRASADRLDALANQLDARGNNRGTAGGVYSAPAGGNTKMAAANQIMNGLVGMAAVMQQSADRQQAEAEQEQLAVQQAAANAQIRAIQQEAEQIQKKVDDQKKVAAAREQFGGFYESSNGPAADSSLSSWVAQPAPAQPAAGDSSALVSDIIGIVSPSPAAANPPPASSNAQVSSLIDSVIPSAAAAPNPALKDMSGILPPSTYGTADNTKTAAIVDDILGRPAQPSTAELAKDGIHPAIIHLPPEPDVGTGAPYFLGENLNKGPEAGLNLHGPEQSVPDFVSGRTSPDIPEAKPAPASTTTPVTPQPALTKDSEKPKLKTKPLPSGVRG